MTEKNIDKATGEIVLTDELVDALDKHAEAALAPPVAPERIKFSNWLRGFGSGALDDELSAELDETVQAVRLLGQTGTVTLKLSLADEAGGVVVKADVSSKIPRQGRAAFFFHDGKRQGLTRRDPAQPSMPGMEDPATED
jgi:hypothetical protein